MLTKTEIWNGHDIRFVMHKGEWWAVAADICSALELGNTTNTLKRIDSDNQALISIKGINRANEPVNIINEFGVYKLIMTSRKPEARNFEKWVFSVIKELRQASGLEGFEVFRMLDKEHQKQAMENLRNGKGLTHTTKIDYIKANTVADKAISNLYGYPKMLKKNDMTPDMLIQRQEALDDAVSLMTANERLGLGLSVSKTVYGKYRH